MMNRNVKIAKQLVRLAKNLIALDEEGDGSGFQPIHDYENLDSSQFDRAAKEGKKYILWKKEGSLWRIRACKDFGHVKKGDFGGLIESEDNLSHEGTCWIADNARVYNQARVAGYSMVSENAKVYDNAKVLGYSEVFGNAEVYDSARVSGNAKIFGSAKVNYDVSKGEIKE